MIKAIIVDDENNSRELLKHLIEKECSESIKILALTESVEAAEKKIRQLLPDLLFLDIEIAGQTGFDLLEKIQDIKLDVIFTTAFDHYALKAIKYSAIDYILKPIDPEELKIAVEKIKQKQINNPSLNQLQLLLQNFKQPDSSLAKISLPSIHGHEIVFVKDIIRLESDSHYSIIYLTGKRKIMVAKTLKNYEDILPSDKFYRIHTSHLVNVEHVVRVNNKDNIAIMIDDSSVEISRRKKEEFMLRLGLL